MPTAASGHLQGHGFFPSRTQTCWIFTEISVNPGKSLQTWQVCYRLADPKCQCLSSALAGLTSYSKRNHQGKSRFAAGMEPEVGADKNQCPWNSSLFGHVFFSPCFAHQSGSIVKIFCEQRSLFSLSPISSS